MVKQQSNYFLSILNNFTNKLLRALIKDYNKGSEFVIKISPFSDKKPKQITKKDIQTLSEITYDSIKGVTESMSKDINYVVKKGILEKKDTKQIAKDLDNVFKGESSIGMNYKARLKMIARTESARVFNTGGFNTAKKFGAKKKYINIVNDNKTSPQSKLFYSKYGSEDKAIPIDQEFIIEYKGKVYSGLYPPFMPNDRDSVIYVFDD